MKTYLVTGAAGFIGANFIKYLLKKYKDDEIKIIVLDALTYAGNLGTIKDDIDNKRCFFVKGNICDRKLADQLFTENDIDYVINFAAESHVDRSIEDPQLFLTVNILGCQNLMDAARKAWVTGKDAQGYPTWKAGKRFHQVSTDEVYGSLGSTGYFTEETPLSPHSPYSASKASADFVVKAYHDTFHLPCTITRCSNNYGPYQFPEKLIPLMIANALADKKLPVYGTGENVRDWLYVEDHCHAIDLILREGKAGEVYNIGGHNERTNLQVVRTILSELGKPESLIEFVTDRKGHDRRYAIDPTKIHEELGWLPATSFETGIKQTIRWYLEHRSWWQNIMSGEYQSYYEKMYGSRKKLEYATT